MDLLNGDLKKLYLKYLTASFGSALVSSIYGVVDMVMVGQYHGPAGSAAMAVIAPIWNILYSFGLLAGIGGSVLFSRSRGMGDGAKELSLSWPRSRHRSPTAVMMASMLSTG